MIICEVLVIYVKHTLSGFKFQPLHKQFGCNSDKITELRIIIIRVKKAQRCRPLGRKLLYGLRDIGRI